MYVRYILLKTVWLIYIYIYLFLSVCLRLNSSAEQKDCILQLKLKPRNYLSVENGIVKFRNSSAPYDTLMLSIRNSIPILRSQNTYALHVQTDSQIATD